MFVGCSLCWCCRYSVVVRSRLLSFGVSVYVYRLLPVLFLSLCCSGSFCIYLRDAPSVGAVSILYRFILDYSLGGYLNMCTG
jgi:hypothetical protein